MIDFKKKAEKTKQKDYFSPYLSTHHSISSQSVGVHDGLTDHFQTSQGCPATSDVPVVTRLTERNGGFYPDKLRTNIRKKTADFTQTGLGPVSSPLNFDCS
jgi:hypothetical protein